MKKLNVLVATAAIVFSTSVSFAQEEGLVAMVESAKEMSVLAQYEAIDIAALPDTVVAAVGTDFAGATIAEAYKDEMDNFKLVLTVGEESKTVYTNATGEWIEPNE